jgi:hypothetical protein
LESKELALFLKPPLLITGSEEDFASEAANNLTAKRTGFILARNSS